MPGDLKLAGCQHEAAAYACKTWHYSGCVPAGKLVKIGVWENGRFIGCVIFGRGANNNIGSKYRLGQTEVCELVRIALRAHEAPVSRIVSLALKLLRRQSPGLRLVVSYADPEQGHVGGIYQAGNWIYTGPSQAQRELVIGGVDVHKRSAGSRYGTASPARIQALTGKPVEYGPVRWKHTYLMPMDKAMRAATAQLSRPYPKREDHGIERAAADADAHPGSDRQPVEAAA